MTSTRPSRSSVDHPDEPVTKPGVDLRTLSSALLIAFAVTACGGSFNNSSRYAPLAGSESPTSPTSSYLTGQVALQDGRMDEAAQRLNLALQADPSNVVLRRQVFFLDVSTGRFEQAVGHAKRLVELEPSMQEPFLLLGLDAANRGDFGEAIERFADIDRRGVIGITVPLLYAWSLFGEGDIEGAFEAFDAPDANDGMDLLNAYHRGLALLLADQADDASEVLDQNITDEIDPVRVVVAAAEAHRAAGRPEIADNILRDELRRQPEDVVLQQANADLAAGNSLSLPTQDAPTAMADALFGLARALDRRRSDPRGMLLGQMAAMLDPGAGDIQLFIARSFLAQDQPDKAIEVLQNLEDGTPWTWEGRLVRAEALFQDDRMSEARSLLEGMADERQTRTDALVALGDILRRDEEFAPAEEAYSQALQRVNEPTAGHWRIYYTRGITFERTQRWPQAEADFLKALDLQPDQPLVLNYLGYSWVDQNLNLERAEAMLVKAVDLRPNDGFIVDSLGWAYYRLGRFDEAVDYLERAVELEPGDPVINDHLGDAYWRAGRLREARFQWERALTFGAEPDIVRKIERKLAEGLPDSQNGQG